jgi:hypothetical protein
MVVGAAVLLAGLFFPQDARAGDLAIVLDAGLFSMSNSADTEKAIFDSKFGVGAGLGLSYDRGSRWRFAVDARRIRREGERAFAADRTSPAFQLGHPLTFTMIEGVASAAYRFGRLGPVSPYIAVGGGVVSWKERSDIAGLVEDANGTSALFEARVGFERRQGVLRLGLEGGIILVPNAIGVGGISKVYEESDLGGVFAELKIGFSRR